MMKTLSYSVKTVETLLEELQRVLQKFCSFFGSTKLTMTMELQRLPYEKNTNSN